ncbi:MAG TPA: cytochrome-c peroxidase [Verrucomicrobiales bacterium]|nr:cytochrome-c peroxidase [Verrucomicrobiales bacterium]
MNVRRWLCLGLLLVTRLEAQQGVLDLTTLANYAAQPVPAYINVNKDNTTPGNAITNAGATLGRVLFYDKRLSLNDTVSCSSCHQQGAAFGDTATASTGVNGTTGRHSMRLINARFATESRFFWDERADTLEAQTTRPIQDHVEMGFSATNGDPAFADLVTKLSAIEEYRVLFALMFGDATITEARVQSALAQFVRSIQSFDSRYDQGRAQVAADNVDFPNFSATENNGKQLFLAPPNQGGAGCAGCHRAPEFDIDPNSRNNGIITKIGGGTDLTNTRAPSLRDLEGPSGTLNGGLMHDGSITSLLGVINHYAAIPGDNATLDPRLRRPGGNVQTLNLNTQQRSDLVAFLRTLTGSAVYTDPKWSSPFNASGGLELIIISATAISFQSNGDGTATLTCRAAPGLSYQLQSASTPAAAGTWTNVTTVTADANGQLQHAVSIGTGAAFFRFTYTPPAS